MSRRYAASDVSIERYDDRKEYRSNGRSREFDERSFEEHDTYRSRGPGRRREKVEREEVRIRERSRTRSPPEFLREDYGKTSAGPVVLRAREREEFDFVPRQRRRSPSPEPERRREKEEIIIRRDESESSGPSREPPPFAPVPPPVRDRYDRPPPRDFDREEIIIRRDEPERPPPRREDRGREEIIIRRDEAERPPPRREERERDELIIRTDDNGRRSKLEVDFDRDDRADRRPPPPRQGRDREEIIIRRDERDDRGYGLPNEREREQIIIRRDERDDDRDSRYLRRPEYDEFALTRAVSHERERSRGRRGSDDEIIIRRDEREGGRRGDRDREEIIIRHRSASRSPSPAPSMRRPPEDPPMIRAPPIHQEVITHHRHIDHGYELALTPTRPRPISRPPSPPMPPPPPAPREDERIEIRRTGERNGRAFDEDIIIDRNQGRSPIPLPGALAPRPPPPPMEPIHHETGRRPGPYYDRNLEEEAAYYNDRALERAYPGEAYRGAVRDWAIVDVPPGTQRVRMDGAGGGEQEITWQRYNGVRRSKFFPDGAPDEGPGYDTQLARPLPAPGPGAGGDLGARYGRKPDPRERLWTEITKDLVIREAIQEMGYEFEETEDFYYVFQYLRFEDISHLVGLSEEIRNGRRKRVQQIGWEQRVMPPEEVRREDRLAIEGPPPGPRSVRGGNYDDVEERYIERDVVYRGPPPPGPRWR